MIGYLSVGAQLTTRPTSFAIITDEATYRKCGKALERYREATEHDGLASTIIHGEWKDPEQLRQRISEFYQACAATAPLEGIVLVGDIPIAMVRNAQHMTTAFKMDEEKYSIRQSSVPSDRFYDDLHLKFRFLKRDSADKALFYYELTEDSPQQLNPTFYSARIRHTEGLGGDKYKAISLFLEKAAKAKYATEQNPLDQVVTYNGAQYNSDCMAAYRDEEKGYRENFPLAFATTTGFKHWNYRMTDAAKGNILSELERTDLDLFMFHEHGSETRQYISDKMDTDSADITTKDLRNRTTNAIMVMLDACYNGSFNDSDYVAGHYIFNPGRTLVVQGNTRNVLQDRWTTRGIGILSCGQRVGLYNQLAASLEGHLIGDPTVRFTPSAASDAPYSESDDASLQCLALRRLVNSDYQMQFSGHLLRQFKESRLNTVRMECLTLLSRYRNNDFKEAVRLGLSDPYERIARSSASYVGHIGDPCLVNDVVAAFHGNKERKRMQYNLDNSLLLFEEDTICAAMESYYNRENISPQDSDRIETMESIHKHYKQRREFELLAFAPQTEMSDRKLAIRLLRNYPRSGGIEKYLQLLADDKAPEQLRILMAEALGWFNYSYRRAEILCACRQQLQHMKQPEALTAEIKQTIKRLMLPGEE